jgi:hypothetical protein
MAHLPPATAGTGADLPGVQALHTQAEDASIHQQLRVFQE